MHGEEQCADQNGEIQKEVAVADVIEVMMDVLVNWKGTIGTQLPQACNSGDHLKSLPVLRVIALYDEGHFRPRSDQGHASEKNVYKLRQFVEAAPS
jgi:hypothetical protein